MTQDPDREMEALVETRERMSTAASQTEVSPGTAEPGMAEFRTRAGTATEASETEERR